MPDFLIIKNKFYPNFLTSYEEKELLHSDLTRQIIHCSFDVIKELDAGFLENVYSAPQAHEGVHNELKLYA